MKDEAALPAAPTGSLRRRRMVLVMVLFADRRFKGRTSSLRLHRRGTSKLVVVQYQSIEEIGR